MNKKLTLVVWFTNPLRREDVAVTEKTAMRHFLDAVTAYVPEFWESSLDDICRAAANLSLTRENLWLGVVGDLSQAKPVESPPRNCKYFSFEEMVKYAKNPHEFVQEYRLKHDLPWKNGNKRIALGVSVSPLSSRGKLRVHRFLVKNANAG
jgi:hypothetical protein